MKETRTLICIPDISGFTEFMSEADFELSSKVIPSLLNNIIYSNEIGLKISEIEGDAVLFYRQGRLPSLQSVLDQCHYFYTEFYRKLHELREQYLKNENANSIPAILGLKIILHYGTQIAPVKVGSRIKLLGEDLIVAHRLLKNNVPFDEYILLSDDFISTYSEEELEKTLSRTSFLKKVESYDHVGEVAYYYMQLVPPQA
ncbi:DUF2652 domain-containing protein [Maribacter sp. 2-571]|uniref:DUF2652 domain-containing protein n=1 Tax=Maribacter sp. 2-571 TaxID=3417569 RepID=UPI003D34A7EB